MKQFFRLITLNAVLSAAFFNSYAQCDSVGWAPDSLQWVFDRYSHGLWDVAKYNDTLYVCGDFEYCGQYTGSNVRVNKFTGDLKNINQWPHTNGGVGKIIPDGSGGLILVGSFSLVGDSIRQGVVRINSSGQVTAFKANTNSSGSVRAALVYNNTLYIGGNFSSINGTTRNEIAALDLTTGALKPWNANANGDVYDIIKGDTGIYVCGAFTTIGGASRGRIASLDTIDGSATAWTANISSGTAYCMLINGSNLYVGGTFSNNVAGVARKRIAAVDKYSGVAKSWYPSNGANDDVHTLALTRNVLYVGGSFDTIGGQKRNGLVALDTGSAQLLSWNPNMGVGTVYTISIGDTIMYIGGSFGDVSGQLRYGFAAVDTVTGALYEHIVRKGNINAGEHRSVSTMLIQGNTLYIGGGFGAYNSWKRQCIAAINLKNNTLLPFNPQFNNLAGMVWDMEVNNGKLYVLGDFATVDGISRKDMACFDLNNNNSLTAWNPFGAITFSGVARKLAVHNSHVYLGGSFSFTQNGAHKYIARVDRDTGNIDSWNIALNGSTNEGIFDMVISNNRLYIGGNFTFGSGRNIMWHDLGTSTNYIYPNAIASGSTPVASIAHKGNSLFVVGDFSYGTSSDKVGGVGFNTVADTTNLWRPWIGYAGGYRRVKAVATVKGMAMFGGEFDYINNPVLQRHNFAAVDTVTGAGLKWHPNFTSVNFFPTFIRNIVAFGDTVFIIGDFSAVDNRYTSCLARFHLNNFVVPSVSVSASTTTVCASSSVTVTASINVSGATYQWKKNGSNVGSNSASYTFTPNNNDQVYCRIIVSASQCYLSNAAQSNTLVFTVTSPTTPTISISAGANNICSGTAVTYTATTNVGVGNYLWKVNNNNAGSNSSSFSYNPSNGDDITCTITPTSGCYSPSSATSNTLTATVLNSIIPTVTVLPSANSICSASQATFSVNTNIISPTYLWKVNGNSVGTNTTYQYSPVNSDVVSCTVTKTTGCYSVNSATDDTTMTVLNYTQPTVSISASTDTVCAGTSITYTATTNVTSAAYQWKVNGNNAGTNNAAFTYTPVNGDSIYCVVTKTTGCYSPDTGKSASKKPLVNPNTTSTITVNASNNSVCAGTSINFTTSTNVTGGTYQWKVGTTNVGTNSPNYSYTPANNDIVSCTVTKPSGTCFLPTSVADDTTMVIIANTVPTVTVTPSANNVCAGATVNFSATTNISSGSYQWKVNSTNVGTNSASYSYIPSNNDVVECAVTKTTGCYAPTSASDDETMTVIAYTTSTASISANPTGAVCAGATVTYTAATNVSGGNYQWKVGSANVGTNNSVYAYTPANNDVVQCIVTATTGCYTPSPVNSNTLTASVTPNTIPTLSISGANNICEGTPDTFTATTNVTGGAFQWKLNGNNVGSNNNQHIFVPSNGDIIRCVITKQAGTCFSPDTAADADTMVIKADTIPVVTITATANPVPCLGLADTFKATTNITGATFQWKVNGSNVGTNDTLHSYNPQNNDIVSCIITVPAAGCYAKTADTSNDITVAVTPVAKPTINITGPSLVLLNATVNLNANLTNSGSNYNIEWFRNSASFANTAVNSTSYTKGAGTDTLFAVITPVGCYDTAISNKITIEEDLGIETIDKSGIKVYPNPFDSYIIINGLADGDAVKLYNVAGKLILTNTISHPQQEEKIEIGAIASGTYTLKISDSEGQLKKAVRLLK